MNNSLSPIELDAVRQSIGSGVVLKISPTAVNQAIQQGREITILDVRRAEDFGLGHVPGAVNFPPEQWAAAPDISKDKVAVVYCYHHTCPLGGAACAELSGRGYPVVEMDGGFDVWEMSEFSVDS